MVWPATPLDVEVAIFLSGVWTDITAYVREDHKVTITRGRRQRAGLPMRGQCTLVLDNANGHFSRHNPAGTYYGVIGKNTQLRVRVNNGGGYVHRFLGYVPGWAPEWDPSENNQTVTITAVGILDRLGRGKAVRSALYGTMSGIRAGAYIPHAYWPLEDGATSARFASGLAGGDATLATLSGSGGAEFAADTAIVGSGALPSLPGGTALNVTVPSYADEGMWAAQMALHLETSDTVAAILLRTSTGITITVTVSPAAGTMTVAAVNVHGTSIFTNSDTLPTTGIVDEGVSLIVGWEDTPGGDLFTTRLYDGQAVTLANTSDTNPGLDGQLTGMTVSSVDGSGTRALGVGHVGVFIDAAFDISTDGTEGARAVSGWAGEMAHERLDRLGVENGVPVGTAATVSTQMGPQLAGTLLANIRDCQNTDMGVLAELTDAEGLTYRATSELANRTAAITLAYGSGQILPPWKPQDDDQEYRNDVTVTRTGGSSARAVDEDGVALVGTYDTGPTTSLYTDNQTDEHAGWLLHLGTVDELTWPAVRPNFYGHPSLLTSWLDTNLGDQLWVTGHPSPLAPDTIRQMVEGYTEVLGSYVCEATIIVSPASVYDIAEVGDAILGRADTDGMVITAAIDDNDLSCLLATTTPTSALATTAAGDFPVDLRLTPDGRLVGEIVTVSDIDAPTTITFGAAGTAAHASNADVTPGIPASVAAGNLLLVLAAIRNSGTGIPNTPTGYTRMPVFPTTSNVQLFGKVAVGGDAAPTITFAGGVANADTSAQMCRIAGSYSRADEVLVVSNALLNASAQDIDYPALNVRQDNNIIFYLGWKQDDWTSVASPGTEIGEPDTTTGDDQGIVWAYTIQTTATDIAAGSFVVTGGAAAISRGAVCAIRSNVQTATISARSVNGVIRSWPARTQIQLATRAVPGL